MSEYFDPNMTQNASEILNFLLKQVHRETCSDRGGACVLQERQLLEGGQPETDLKFIPENTNEALCDTQSANITARNDGVSNIFDVEGQSRGESKIKVENLQSAHSSEKDKSDSSDHSYYDSESHSSSSSQEASDSSTSHHEANVTYNKPKPSVISELFITHLQNIYTCDRTTCTYK